MGFIIVINPKVFQNYRGPAATAFLVVVPGPLFCKLFYVVYVSINSKWQRAGNSIFDLIIGVKGLWKGQENRDSLTLTRPGKFPNSGTTTVLSANTNKPTFAIGDFFSHIWESFKREGSLNTTVRGTGFNGAIAVSARLPAGEEETLTFIMAWHYPNRDHAGLLVGNYYRYA